jgi:hypothetical protein
MLPCEQPAEIPLLRRFIGNCYQPNGRDRAEVESWRELQSRNIEFTMKRLREPLK